MGLTSSVTTLIKFKLSLAVTLSAAAGFFLYPHHSSHDFLLMAGGVFFLAGGSAALNQLQEYRRDSMMERTNRRPIPTGELSIPTAMVIVILFFLVGILLLSITGLTPVILGLLTVLLYNGLYTWLKPLTSFAVLPGGLVGAIPPLIGWTAAGGPVIHPAILFVCTLLFLWQVPHFWLLIIRYGEEYETAGFATIRRKLNDNQIRRLVFWWMTVTLGFLLTAPLFGIDISKGMLAGLVILNAILIAFFYLVLFLKPTKKMVRMVFILTNFFLALVLIALILISVI